MLSCATCDDALRILQEEGLMQQTLDRLMTRISENLNRRTGEEPTVEVIVFSNVYGTLGETDRARNLLDKWGSGEDERRSARLTLNKNADTEEEK